MKHWNDFWYGAGLALAALILTSLLLLWYAKLMLVYEFEGYLVLPMFAVLGGLIHMLVRWWK